MMKMAVTVVTQPVEHPAAAKPVMTVYMILPIMAANAAIQHGMNLVSTVPL